MDEKVYWYWLSHRDGIGAVKADHLLERFGSAKGIFAASKIGLMEKGGLSEKKAEAIMAGRKEFDTDAAEFTKLGERGIRMITAADPEFPQQLLTIPGRPMWLFVKGELPLASEVSVAIVGARACTEYGEEQAAALAGALAHAGCWIVSGLAHGIDAAAHHGAVKVQGKTLAVLGCGVDICYPKENYWLYERILECGGGIVSEYPPGTRPLAQHFPVRNRLISGLADALLVMEARRKSGSLITVERALEQGKEVFALPGRVTDPLSRGCLELVRDGAHILTSAEDVLETLHVSVNKSLNNSEEVKISLAEDEKVVYSAIAHSAKHLDEILRMVPLSGVEVYSALVSLELQGLIRQTSQNYYMRAQA